MDTDAQHADASAVLRHFAFGWRQAVTSGWVDRWAEVCLKPDVVLLDHTPDTTVICVGRSNFTQFYNGFLKIHGSSAEGPMLRWEFDEQSLRSSGERTAAAEADVEWTWVRGTEEVTKLKHRIQYEFRIAEGCDAVCCEMMAIRARGHLPASCPRRYNVGASLDPSQWSAHLVSPCGDPVRQQVPTPSFAVRDPNSALHLARRRAAAGLSSEFGVPASAVADAWCKWLRRAGLHSDGPPERFQGECIDAGAILVDCCAEAPAICVGGINTARYAAALSRSLGSALETDEAQLVDDGEAEVRARVRIPEAAPFRFKMQFRVNSGRIEVITMATDAPSLTAALPRIWSEASPRPQWAVTSAAAVSPRSRVLQPLLKSWCAATAAEPRAIALAQWASMHLSPDCMLVDQMPRVRPRRVHGRAAAWAYCAAVAQQFGSAGGPVQWEWTEGGEGEADICLSVSAGDGEGVQWRMPISVDLTLEGSTVRALVVKPFARAEHRGAPTEWKSGPPPPLEEYNQFRVGGGVHFAKPCDHNDWENLRLKRGWVYLRCRVCSSTWRHRPQDDSSCGDFASPQGCALGSACKLLHVAARKRTAQERSTERA
eukprot:TRINITY_DN5691_c0_g1_i1.p1 TRINITY_DN5691_c0_g1~~TRINITY_DN5691_c0_g1_i1.p1  ORF type:complete len:599 (+),score=50.21 TRINITY_DN5691_c0_g1_i1:66-1862(+)